MKLIVDVRERDLYDKFATLEIPASLILTQEQLPLGDIIIKTDEDETVAIIERKTINDMLASVSDGRYKEQSFRLQNTAEIPRHNIIYLLEGVLSNYPAPKKKIVYGVISSLQFFKGFSVWRASSLGETAELLLNCAQKLQKEIYEKKTALWRGGEAAVEEGAGAATAAAAPPPAYASAIKVCKKENITAENIGEIMLLQIPGISHSSAVQIMQECKSMGTFIEKLRENPDFLTEIKIGTGEKKRKISKTVVENIKRYLL